MPKFDIAGHRKIWFLISALIIIPGLFCMAVRGFNFGIDFTGGTIIDLKFDQPVTIAQVRQSLTPFGLEGSTIQLSGAESGVTEGENVMIKKDAGRKDAEYWAEARPYELSSREQGIYDMVEQIQHVPIYNNIDVPRIKPDLKVSVISDTDFRD